MMDRMHPSGCTVTCTGLNNMVDVVQKHPEPKFYKKTSHPFFWGGGIILIAIIFVFIFCLAIWQKHLKKEKGKEEKEDVGGIICRR